MVQIALAPCSPFSVTTSLMRRDRGARRQARRPPAHPSGRRPRTRTNSASRCMAAGRSIISNNAAGSMRGPGWRTASHFNADEMKRLGKAKTAISHCACSNQLLASGCCPVCEMEEAGVAIGLGVDGSASNDESNLMQEVRAAFLLQRARYGVGRVSHKRRAALGHQGLGGLRRPSRARRDRRRQSRRSRRCSSSTNCASPAMAIPWPRWCCAARIAPTA